MNETRCVLKNYFCLSIRYGLFASIKQCDQEKEERIYIRGSNRISKSFSMTLCFLWSGTLKNRVSGEKFAKYETFFYLYFYLLTSIYLSSINLFRCLFPFFKLLFFCAYTLCFIESEIKNCAKFSNNQNVKSSSKQWKKL